MTKEELEAMIEFDKIFLEGFGSFIRETKFKLNRPGLNIIIADNGSGKTTVFSGLFWTLYGKTLKETKTVETWLKFRPDDYQGTKNKVSFKKAGKVYEIIRCKNYKGKVLNAKGGNRIIILENGTDITKRDKRGSDGIQAQINDILGYSPELFLNSIIFGQRLKRLIQETGPNKKKVFEEAFEASFINLARKKAETDYTEVKEEYLQLTKEKESLAERRISQRRLMFSEKKSLEDKTERINKDIKYWQDKVDDLGIYVSKLENITSKAIDVTTELEDHKKRLKKIISKSNLKQLEDEEFRTKNQIDRDDYHLGLLENKLETFKLQYTQVIKKCPRCGGKLNPTKIKEERAKIKADTTTTKELILKAKSDLKETQNRYSKLLESISSNKKDKDKIRLLEDQIKRLETDSINQRSASKNIGQKRVELQEAIDKLNDLKKESQTLSKKPYLDAKADLTKLRSQQGAIRNTQKPLKKKFQDLSWLVNDALSNKGIKSYIFDTMLKQLNNQLKYYTQFIGMRPEFLVDLDSANKDLYGVVYDSDGDLALYEDLSGGQAQLIDIVTSFAMHDITTAGRPCNIVVLDEVFEGLDEGNVDIVLDLIQDKAKDKSLFLISHNANLHNSSTKVIKMHRNPQGQTILKMLQP